MGGLLDNKFGIREGHGWRPTVKQEKFLALPLSIKEGFYAGAMGAGKSDVLLMYPVAHGWINHPSFKALYLRRTYDELKLEIIPRSREYFEPLGAKYNQTDKRWTFPSGALYIFGHCEHEDDVHKYDSMQPNYVAFDELTSFLLSQYIYISIERCRTNENLKAEGLPEIVRSASNPGNIGHAWVKERFIDPCPEGGKIIRGKGGVKRIFIPATIIDNPHVSKQYILDLDALPEAERQAKKFGSWTAYEGQVFNEFRDRRYSDEPEAALHVIPSFPIPDFWPRIVSIDWGTAAMCCVLYGAISPNRRVYIYREQAFFGDKIAIWAQEVKKYIDAENVKQIVICHSAGQDRGNPQTIQQQVETELGTEGNPRPITLSVRDRVGTKNLLHEYLRWRPKEVPKSEILPYSQEQGEWILRNRGVDSYRSYLRLYEPPVEEELPKLLIFSDANVYDGAKHGAPKETPYLVESIKSCVYDKTIKEDVAEFPGDDPYDDIRYLIAEVEKFFEESKDEFEKVQKREEILNRLSVTQDMTNFYIMARRQEAVESGPKPVARYHHKRREEYVQ